jgi:hypothetical protein
MRIEFTFSRSQEYFGQQLRLGAKRVARRTVLRAVALGVIGPVLILISQGEGLELIIGVSAVLAAFALPIRAWRVFKEAVTVPPSW